MLKLLLGSAAVATVLLLTQPAKSAVIATLADQSDIERPVTSLSAPGAGAFADQFVFGLVGGPQFITIANGHQHVRQPRRRSSLNWTAAIWSAGPDGGEQWRRCAAVRPAGRHALSLVRPTAKAVGGSALIDPRHLLR